MKINIATKKDLTGLLQLYTQLHNNPMPSIDKNIFNLWNEILKNKNQYIIIGSEEEKIISSCVLIIVPNLTHEQRPYAIIENVITDENNRNEGYATQILNIAKDIAIKQNCYKIMLMTGSKNEATLNFYKKAGYNSEDKTAFIQWL